jgi:hypothetical protein
MRAQAARTAVCVVRLERQDGQVLIFVQLVPDTAVYLISRRQPFVDPGKAMDLVSGFVEAFVQEATREH